jgi:hypothetical protein
MDSHIWTGIIQVGSATVWARVVGLLERRGRLGRWPGCGLGPSAARWSGPRCRGAAGRSGQLSREQREEEGERADGRARGVSGRGGVESERARPQRRWAELACARGRKRREWV